MLIPSNTIFLKMQKNMFGLPMYVIHSYTLSLLHHSMTLWLHSTSRGRSHNNCSYMLNYLENIPSMIFSRNRKQDWTSNINTDLSFQDQSF